MNEIDPITGLPKELLTEEKLGRENTAIKLYSKKAKFDKVVTIIEGVPKDNMETTLKKLKQKIACGGTIKDGHIELQGDHKERARRSLIDLGFDGDKIETVS